LELPLNLFIYLTELELVQLLLELLQVVVDQVVYKIGIYKQVKVGQVVAVMVLLELFLEVQVLLLVVEQTLVVVEVLVMQQGQIKELVDRV
tara:strand:+ start:257 stop:529 length:273 start_codon:yes stop_codon:yes gene_type:complete